VRGERVVSDTGQHAFPAPIFPLATLPLPQNANVSNLYIVSTPIGNLGDMTFRGVEVLRSAACVLAEDTRRTKVLFSRYDIHTPLVSAYAHNEQARVGRLLAMLGDGADVALVSDAGTPLLSDPGARLVNAALEAGHSVVPVPGASAALAALVAAGIAAEPFTFFGFVPRSGVARSERLREIAASPHTSVLYEAPGRLKKLLTDLAEVCESARNIAVGRELTKLHESFFRGTLADAVRYYGAEGVRGEVVVVVAGAPTAAPEASGAETEQLVRELIRGGMRPSAAAREAAGRLRVSRNEAYEIALTVQRESGGVEE
jgi:16S rRNA (cytidine1402-2'-O)-methyltransferase